MIIDFHCHGGKGDLMTAPWNSAARLDLYFKRAALAGISKTVLLPAFHSDYRQANEQLARVVEKYPDRLIGFGMVHAKRDRGRIYPCSRSVCGSMAFAGSRFTGTRRCRRESFAKPHAGCACRCWWMLPAEPRSSR